MNSVIVTAVFVVLCTSMAVATIWNKINATNFLIKEVSRCEDEGTKKFDGNLRLNRKNRTLVVLEGNVTLKVPVDNSLETTILVEYWGNGGWKLVYTFYKINICKDLAFLLGNAWTSIWVHAGFTPPVKCPIPKGDYELKDFNTQDFIKANVPALTSGKFRLTQKFLRKKSNEVLGCIIFVVELTSSATFG